MRRHLSKENREKVLKISEKRVVISSILVASYFVIWNMKISGESDWTKLALFGGAVYSFLYVILYGVFLLYPNTIRRGILSAMRFLFESSLSYSIMFSLFLFFDRAPIHSFVIPGYIALPIIITSVIALEIWLNHLDKKKVKLDKEKDLDKYLDKYTEDIL